MDAALFFSQEILVLKELEREKHLRDQFGKETVTVCFSEGAASLEYRQEFTSSLSPFLSLSHTQGAFRMT